MNTSLTIEQITDKDLHKNIDQLASLLNDCVTVGASVGFVQPHTIVDSRIFWETTVRPAVTSGSRRLFIAVIDQIIVGTVQLEIAMFPNQRHRAEVGKLLVDPKYRRNGVARTLMVNLEEVARDLGRSLLTLDTISGCPAEGLYRTLGFMAAGEIPGYARNPHEDRLEPTLFMYKTLTRVK